MESTSNLSPDGNERDGWKFRRRFMIVYTIAVLTMVGYVVFTGQDTETGRTVVSTGFTSLAGLVGAYIFGAAWESKK